jgi:SAM-dependent methyltransferase
VTSLRNRRTESRSWFMPREPDWAVRQWGDMLARSGCQRVLDLGCGSGRHVVYLVHIGMLVTAGDCSAQALTETRRWLAREDLRATLVQLEMTALPFANGSFDAVLTVNVLEHGRPGEAQAAVSEVWRVLRPGGAFLAVVAGGGDGGLFSRFRILGADWHMPSVNWRVWAQRPEG